MSIHFGPLVRAIQSDQSSGTHYFAMYLPNFLLFFFVGKFKIPTALKCFFGCTRFFSIILYRSSKTINDDIRKSKAVTSPNLSVQQIIRATQHFVAITRFVYFSTKKKKNIRKKCILSEIIYYKECLLRRVDHPVYVKLTNRV